MCRRQVQGSIWKRGVQCLPWKLNFGRGKPFLGCLSMQTRLCSTECRKMRFVSRRQVQGQECWSLSRMHFWKIFGGSVCKHSQLVRELYRGQVCRIRSGDGMHRVQRWQVFDAINEQVRVRLRAMRQRQIFTGSWCFRSEPMLGLRCRKVLGFFWRHHSGCLHPM